MSQETAAAGMWWEVTETIDKSVFGRLRGHLKHACDKYPWPAKMSDADKFRAAERELNELAAAMLKGDKRGITKEALDCAAVLLRIAEGE